MACTGRRAPAADLRRRPARARCRSGGRPAWRFTPRHRADARRFRDVDARTRHLGASGPRRCARHCLRQHRRLEHRERPAYPRRIGGPLPDRGGIRGAAPRWAGHGYSCRDLRRPCCHDVDGQTIRRRFPLAARRIRVHRVPAGAAGGADQHGAVFDKSLALQSADPGTVPTPRGAGRSSVLS